MWADLPRPHLTCQRSSRQRRRALAAVRACRSRRRVLTGPSAAALRDRIATFESWVSAMAKGESMSVTYRPGTGVQIEIRGEAKGTVPGADFAQALFRIWLGPSPPNAGLKEGLLGKG